MSLRKRRARRSRFPRRFKPWMSIFTLIVFWLHQVYSFDGELSRVAPRTLRKLRREFAVNWRRILRSAISQPDYNNESFPHKFQVYVLSLQRANRSEPLLNNMTVQGIKYTSVAAVDGLSFFNRSDMLRYAGPRRRRKFQSDSAGTLAHRSERTNIRDRMRFGCYLTHCRIWERISHMGDAFAIILEDDVDIAAEFLAKLFQILNRLPADWDVFYLGSTAAKKVGYVREHTVLLKGALGTFGYILSKRGAQKLLAGPALNSDQPIDHVLDLAILTGCVRAYQADNVFVSHSHKQGTTIDIESL